MTITNEEPLSMQEVSKLWRQGKITAEGLFGLPIDAVKRLFDTIYSQQRRLDTLRLYCGGELPKDKK